MQLVHYLQCNVWIITETRIFTHNSYPRLDSKAIHFQRSYFPLKQQAYHTCQKWENLDFSVRKHEGEVKEWQTSVRKHEGEVKEWQDRLLCQRIWGRSAGMTERLPTCADFSNHFFFNLHLKCGFANNLISLRLGFQRNFSS